PARVAVGREVRLHRHLPDRLRHGADPGGAVRSRRSGRTGRALAGAALAGPCVTAAPLLSLERVTKRFGGLTAVRDVSLDVHQGDLLGVIGPNGAGKTTLFNVIAGYYRPEEGRIVFDGHAITGWPAHAIARLGLTRTFQIVKPFGNLSVLDNVM